MTYARRNAFAAAMLSVLPFLFGAVPALAVFQLQIPVTPTTVTSSGSSGTPVASGPTNPGECPPSFRINVNGTLYAATDVIPYPAFTDAAFWNNALQGYLYTPGNWGFGDMAYGLFFWGGAGVPVSWDATPMADGTTAPAGTGTMYLDVMVDLTESQVSDEVIAYWTSTGHIIPADYYWTRQTLQLGGVTFSGNTPYVGGAPATEAQIRAALSAGYASTDPSVYYASYGMNHAAADIAAYDLAAKAGVVPVIPPTTTQYVPWGTGDNMNSYFAVKPYAAGTAGPGIGGSALQAGFKVQCMGYQMAF